MKIIDGIPTFGAVDSAALSQIKTCLKYGVKAALMADNHKGYCCPIGGVVAMKDKVSPPICGYDLFCGNKAVCLDVEPSYVIKNISKIMDLIQANISFGVGQKNGFEVDCPIFDMNIWNNESLRGLKDLARNQLGSVGTSNHFVDVFISNLNEVWIGVHCGSRGFGHKVASYYFEKGGAKDGMDVDPIVFDVDSDLGQNYIFDLSIMSQYAYAGRDWVCSKVAELIGGKIVEEVHNHHNFARLEEHGGEKLWVHRKGATPAFPNQKGFIGATMFENSVIIEGVDSEMSKYTLYSTVHGAGRVMGRSEAKGKFDKKTGVCKRAGKVTQQMMDEWKGLSDVELRGGGVDESPHCYKRLSDVISAHGDTIRVLRTLRPIGVCMAGDDEKGMGD